MGEIVRVDVDRLRAVADRVRAIADELADAPRPACAVDALPGSAVAASAVALGAALDAAVAGVAGTWRDWAASAHRSAVAVERADRDALGGDRTGG